MQGVFCRGIHFTAGYFQGLKEEVPNTVLERERLVELPFFPSCTVRIERVAESDELGESPW